MNIEFYPAHDGVPDWTAPVPATECVPDYWRQIPPPTRQKPEFSDDGVFQSNVRACVPFGDALTAGYIQRSWADIYIDFSADGVLTYRSSNEALHPMQHRERGALTSRVMDTYPVEFIWQGIWNPKTPRGYSLLITHPMNRYDLPFLTTSGVIDSDTFTLGNVGMVPFYIRKGFTGLIPAGTPMYQIVPVRRESWVRQVKDATYGINEAAVSRIGRYFTGAYRRQYWHRKDYN